MEDIEIARKAKLENITKIATKLGIDEEYIEQYGKYKAKVDFCADFEYDIGTKVWWYQWRI